MAEADPAEAATPKAKKVEQMKAKAAAAGLVKPSIKDLKDAKANARERTFYDRESTESVIENEEEREGGLCGVRPRPVGFLSVGWEPRESLRQESPSHVVANHLGG